MSQKLVTSQNTVLLYYKTLKMKIIRKENEEIVFSYEKQNDIIIP